MVKDRSAMAAFERKIKILLYPGNDFHGPLQPESLQVLVRQESWNNAVISTDLYSDLPQGHQCTLQRPHSRRRE